MRLLVHRKLAVLNFRLTGHIVVFYRAEHVLVRSTSSTGLRVDAADTVKVDSSARSADMIIVHVVPLGTDAVLDIMHQLVNIVVIK